MILFSTMRKDKGQLRPLSMKSQACGASCCGSAFRPDGEVKSPLVAVDVRPFSGPRESIASVPNQGRLSSCVRTSGRSDLHQCGLSTTTVDHSSDAPPMSKATTPTSVVSVCHRLLVPLIHQVLMYLDKTIGQLVDYLEKEGWLDNSVIVVASDNGGCASDGGSNLPLRGVKGSYWEGGVKVGKERKDSKQRPPSTVAHQYFE